MIFLKWVYIFYGSFIFFFSYGSFKIAFSWKCIYIKFYRSIGPQGLKIKNKQVNQKHVQNHREFEKPCHQNYDQLAFPLVGSHVLGSATACRPRNLIYLKNQSWLKSQHRHTLSGSTKNWNLKPHANDNLLIYNEKWNYKLAGLLMLAWAVSQFPAWETVL